MSFDGPERVLVLITSLNRGGAETMAMNYYRHFDRNVIQYDFLVNREEIGAYEEEIQSLGGRIYRMCPMYPQYFHRYKKEFRAFLREHPEYRIIHSNLEERSYFPLKIAAEENVPVRISHAHNEYRTHDLKTPFRDYFRHHLRPYITDGFACSTEAGIWLYGEDAMRTGKIKIVQNAIDPKLYCFNPIERDSLRTKLKLTDRFVVGNVGRLAEQKNQRFLLDVFLELHKKRSDTFLLLVGEGELRDSLIAYATELGIGNDIAFVGSVPNVWDYLQAMDCFVFPSLYEGLGMSLIEAQATGLPCVASSAVPTEADITGNVKTLPLTLSAQEWAEAILDFNVEKRSSNRSLLKSKHFDIEDEAKKLQAFYLKSIEK